MHQNAGQLQQAEQLYLEILEVHPKHAQVNYQLGLVIVELKGAIEALPRLETAVETDPENEQYWVTYIDALVQCNFIDKVINVLKLGQQYGLKTETAKILAEELGLTF